MSFRSQDNAVDVSSFDTEHIRNFAIISHVDHGKSTLSQRMLQETGSIVREVESTSSLFMDSLQVEQERGITVHSSTASMTYKGHLLNLIDTPGHVDFQYEVSRALQACEGAVLLVDCTKGVQAQTISNFWLAFSANLTIVPVINKIDLDHADVPNVLAQLKSIFEIDESEVIAISAKTGNGVQEVLDRVIATIPAPLKAKKDGSSIPPGLKALLFDSHYDRHVGVVLLWRLLRGSVQAGDRIKSLHSGREYSVADVGLLFPGPKKATKLHEGQVGYVTCAMKSAPEAFPGDTFVLCDDVETTPLPGFKGPRAVVFAGLFATAQSETALLADAMEKILLTDNSVQAHKESSLALGTGYRCGFLGVLHMEVFMQRLLQEYNLEVIATAPTVPYKLLLKDGSEIICSNPADFPDHYERVFEPIVRATIVVPSEHVGAVMQLCMERRATPDGLELLGDSTIMRFVMPVAETISGFFDKLKEITSGYASYEYEPNGYEATDLVKLDILLNGQSADPLATLVHRSSAREWGTKLTQRLKKEISRQLFEVIIQAAQGNKVLCRERIAPLRKNVTAKCYGGDQTRKRKLLDKQKAGKKRMRSIGNVEISQEAFFSVLKN